MKRSLASVSLVSIFVLSSSAQVWINEVLPNAPGSDTGNEYFELRGTPGLSLANYYLISVEGQGAGTPGKGDINQFFDLGAFSLGANGYLFARQAGSQYLATEPGAAVIENTSGTTGFGQVNGGGSSVGHYSDGTQVDMENGATTILLVNIGTGQPPAITLDLDTDNDGLLDLPEGWTVVDSVGIMDGASAAATDSTYGAINFRVEGQPGTSAYGNMIDVPGPMTTTAGTFHVGRKGESTGSTAADWFGSILNGAAASPLNFYFYSSSDPAYSGRIVSDMLYGGLNPPPDPLGTVPYTPTIHGTRFTNYTQIVIGGTVGAVAVDPRDNSTILFTSDSAVGGIFRASKVASGNWAVDSTPVVAGLDRPSGLLVDTNGTLWWVHDVTMALKRLKSPWAANTPETVITNFGLSEVDDDPIDLTIAPASFAGSLGHPNWLVIADRGSDDNTLNALYLVDPATAEVIGMHNNLLVNPTASDLGWGDLDAIGSLPQSGEVVTVSQDGFITAVGANGSLRYIIPTTFWPLGSTPSGSALAVDPKTGRLWLADDSLDEVWSVDPSSTGQTPDQKELSFPLTDPTKTYRQIDFHDPGMTFAANGELLVISDSSTAGGGGRLLIFHNEEFAVPEFKITSVAQTSEGVQLDWASAGSVHYAIERGTDIASAASYSTLATNLTDTSFTDTNPPAGGAFYRVLAKP